jgi:exosortase
MTQDVLPTTQQPKTGLADIVGGALEPAPAQLFGRGTMLRLAALAALFAVGHWWQLTQMVARWYHETNWSYCFLIPLFSLFLLYVRHNDLAALRWRPTWWGLPVVLAAVFGELTSFFVLQNNWIFQINMVLMLLGLVLMLGGWSALRLLWLPVAFLFFALPLPDQLYTQISLPLQNFVTRCTGAMLHLFGAKVETSASQLTVTSVTGVVHPLQVIEACSGIRSLTAFVALSVVFAYLQNRPVWQRVVLVLMAVPVAVLCNVLRVAITASMFIADKPEWGSDFMHEVAGFALMVPAALMLWLLSWVMQSLYVEVDEEDEAPKRSPEASP